MSEQRLPFTPVNRRILDAVGVPPMAELLDPSLAVYPNRDIDLGHIEAVGFDMDYTLAIYRKLPMEQLQYDLTVESLVTRHGYPEAIRELIYDPQFIVRGLTVDKRSGHLLKTDTHGRVGRCFRGRKQINPEEVGRLYKNAKIRLASATFASVDTLFAMPEACLYANLVDYFDEQHGKGASTAPVSLPDNHQTQNLGPFDTWKLFDDVRRAIDDIHRDGTLKSIIMADIGKYIEEDDQLAVALHKLRSAGKKVFVLTNSYWLYTDAVMKFLLDGKLKEYASWRQYFDFVLVGGRKPRFFTEREPFLEVDEERSAEEQRNVVHGEARSDRFEKGKVYQGGNIEAFERMAQVVGEEVLYVGDHIFGDILRSKKDSRWRTCLIVEELQPEIEGFVEWADDINRLGKLDQRRHTIDEAINVHRSLVSNLEVDSENFPDSLAREVRVYAKQLRKEIDQAKRELRALDREIEAHQEAVERRFNPYWGRLLKEQNELSRFGAQVALYADMYTSRVSNFLQYSPVHYYRAPRELMSHDRALIERGPSVARAPTKKDLDEQRKTALGEES
jgi:HAD superfamily 5'-nucleotidase-like hydrolase